MKLYDASKSLYMEMGASGIGFGTRLLQMHEGMNCKHEEVPGNVALHPIAFASKSLSSMEWMVQQC